MSKKEKNLLKSLAEKFLKQQEQQEKQSSVLGKQDIAATKKHEKVQAVVSETQKKVAGEKVFASSGKTKTVVM